MYDPENSYMTFEGQQAKGRDGILQKFTVCAKVREFNNETLLDSRIHKNSTSDHCD